MQCYNHPDTGAVLFCEGCSKGLCRQCADQFNQPICDICAKKQTEATMANAKATLKAIKKSYNEGLMLIIWAILTMIVGLVFYLGFDYGVLMVFCFFLGGFPWIVDAIRNHKKSKEQSQTEILKDIRDEMFWHSIGGQHRAAGYLIGIIIVFVALLILAPYITPLMTVVAVIGQYKLKNRIIELEKFIQS